MFGYLDFVYTKDGRFGMVLGFDKKVHKFKVVFEFGKHNENTAYFYKEDLKVVL